MEAPGFCLAKYFGVRRFEADCPSRNFEAAKQLTVQPAHAGLLARGGVGNPIRRRTSIRELSRPCGEGSEECCLIDLLFLLAADTVLLVPDIIIMATD